MGLNRLKPPPGSRAARRRVGRGIGSGLGKTAGRGHKGQKARSGGFHKIGFEGGQMPLHRRVPKRGFNNVFRVAYDVVNLDQLEARFDAGATVTPEALRDAGLVTSRWARIKVLARGEVTKPLTVRVHKFSSQAAGKIAAAGGAAEPIS